MDSTASVQWNDEITCSALQPVAKGRHRGTRELHRRHVGAGPRAGAPTTCVNPATGEVIAEVAEPDAADVDAAVAAAAGGVRRVVADDARGSGPRCCTAVADAIEDDVDDARASSRCATSASPRSIIEFEMDLTRRQPGASSAGAPASSKAAPRASTSRATRRYVRRDPLGVVAVDRAVELPAQHGDVEARSRARGRQHRGAEAVGAHAAHRRCASPRSPPTSSRPGVFNVVHRPGRDRGRRARAPPRSRDGVAHRRRRDRQDHRPHRGRLAQARAPRARRQGAGRSCSTTPTSRR